MSDTSALTLGDWYHGEYRVDNTGDSVRFTTAGHSHLLTVASDDLRILAALLLGMADANEK